MKSGLVKTKTAFVVTIVVFSALTSFVHFNHNRAFHVEDPSPDDPVSPQTVWVKETPSKTLSLGSHLTQNQRDYCTRTGGYDVVPEYYRRLLVNDEYKIIYCSVPKIGCSNWGRVFLILTGRMNTTKLTNIKSVHGTYKSYFKWLREYSVEEIRHRLDTYYKFMFTREPLERVLSAYLNKFKSNNPYFHTRFGKKIVSRFRLQSNTSKGDDVTFPEFVQYITDFTRTEEPNEHWQRIADICQPCSVKYDFIGSMDTMDVDSQRVLKHIGVSDRIQFPKRSVRYKNPKTKSLSRSFYSRLPPALFDQLLREYEPDFLMFNLSVPVDLQELAWWISKY